MNAAAFIGLISQAIDSMTPKSTLAVTLGTSIEDLRVFVRLNMPGKLDAFDALPSKAASGAHDDADTVEQYRSRSMARRLQRKRLERRSQPGAGTSTARRDVVFEEIVGEMWDVRARLGVGPKERIFSALPRSVQKEIREKAREFIAYMSGIRQTDPMRTVDRMIKF